MIFSTYVPELPSLLTGEGRAYTTGKEKAMLEIKKLSLSEAALVEGLFGKLPETDERSTSEGMKKYLEGRFSGEGSLVMGLFEDNALVGAALGEIVDWFMGPEYYIHDLLLKNSSLEGEFMAKLTEYAKSVGAESVYLEKDTELHF